MYLLRARTWTQTTCVLELVLESSTSTITFVSMLGLWLAIFSKVKPQLRQVQRGEVRSWDLYDFDGGKWDWVSIKDVGKDTLMEDVYASVSA